MNTILKNFPTAIIRLPVNPLQGRRDRLKAKALRADLPGRFSVLWQLALTFTSGQAPPRGPAAFLLAEMVQPINLARQGIFPRKQV
jgi:hypothetical protein